MEMLFKTPKYLKSKHISTSLCMYYTSILCFYKLGNGIFFYNVHKTQTGNLLNCGIFWKFKLQFFMWYIIRKCDVSFYFQFIKIIFWYKIFPKNSYKFSTKNNIFVMFTFTHFLTVIKFIYFLFFFVYTLHAHNACFYYI